MLFVVGVLILLVGVALSIALHEIGHLVPAKRFGVKVTQYMVGFGPTLWSRRRGETEYGVKAIPLGGYIRMIGMFPPRPGDAPGQVRVASTGRFSQMVDQMRDEAYEQVTPGDEDRVFYRLPSWQKIVVMFGGPFMNLLIASVLLIVVACGIGLPKQTSTQVSDVQTCLTTTLTVKGAPNCAAAPASPAAVAGMRARDTLVSVAGVPVHTTPQAIREIRRHPQATIPVVVRRDEGGRSVERTLQVTPAARTVTRMDADGNPVLDTWGTPVTDSAGVIGASIGGGTWVTSRASLLEAPSIIGSGVKQTASVFVKIPQKMLGVVSATFGDGQRDANGPVSVVGVGRLAGDVADRHNVSLADKITALLGMLASLNLALFVFNLVPLLPLDGGHIAGAIWEAIKKAWFRWRGIARPAYVDVAKAMPLAYGVSLLLIVMFGLLMYADIVNPIRLGG